MVKSDRDFGELTDFTDWPWMQMYDFLLKHIPLPSPVGKPDIACFWLSWKALRLAYPLSLVP